ncbi:DUF3261 domain-containing protein [Sneathiella marina]|uniref:DUF3261 domain-containing protein n=1 Tax=Sneathiella marina TaxID=2950108 RepID=A0ABY4W621_9PROT|nr:DUF3261 domain-containing protein [Sneathiella marina]USG62623.1 DUF3261 domain-containing protein [Sneathiella marina]
MRLTVFQLLVFLTLAGCSTAEQRRSDAPGWTLPDKPREVVQILSGHYGDQNFQLQVRLSMSAEQMRMVGLDSLGRRAFEINWDDQGLTSGRASWVSEELQALDILKVVVVTYWPQDTEVYRQFLDAKEKQLQIKYESSRQNAWNETVQITDPKNDYEMTIISYEIDK